MQHIKVVNYKDIGAVLYQKNPRAKNLSLRIKNDGKVRVTIPYWCSYRKAELFVQGRFSWIRQKLSDIERNNASFLAFKPGDEIKYFLGTIQIIAGREDQYRLEEVPAGYHLHIPASKAAAEQVHSDQILELMAIAGLDAARRTLPGIMANIAGDLNIHYNKLTVKRMRSRWGSCSHKNNISLNSALIFLEYPVIEYVCIHELMHVIHKNHGREFWQAVETALPDYAARRKELRHQSIIA